jgi:RNA polymerase sigma-70 factor (ECF subfamily)
LSRAEIAVGFLDKPDIVDVREALLVERLKANDPSAHDELLLMYRDPILRIAYRMLGDTCEASDVHEEIFLKVTRSIRSFRGDSTLRIWVFRNALSEIRRRLHWWKRKYRGDGNDDLIQHGLRRLSRDLRWVVVLRDIENFSYAEISEVTGISVKTVSSRLARARGGNAKDAAALPDVNEFYQRIGD